MALGRFVLTANVTIPWPATWAEVIQGAANVPVATPAIASGTAFDNAAGVAVAVTVTGGTVTIIAVNGTATGLTTGTVIVPYPGTIQLTYTGSPSWAWAAAVLPQSGTSSMTAAVSATAPPGGQAGTMMQFTFLAGTAIYADSSGGTNGPCQLYNAIGAGNLTAWIDGTSNVGHAAISN